MVEIEYELTFLAKSIPNEIKNLKPVEVIDYYIPESGVIHPHLRIRSNKARYEITKKQPINGSDSSEQSEHTISISMEEYNDLVKGRRRSVIKHRYSTVYMGHRLDVDIFKGSLKGLVLIDFEFNSKKDKDKFKAPDFCLADVTQESFIAGGLLAGKSYQDIEKELARYSYQKIV